VLNASTNLNTIGKYSCAVNFKIVGPSGTEIKINGSKNTSFPQSLENIVNDLISVPGDIDIPDAIKTTGDAANSTLDTTPSAVFMLETKDWAVGDYQLSIKANSSCNLHRAMTWVRR